eukprot:999344_1
MLSQAMERSMSDVAPKVEPLTNFMGGSTQSIGAFSTTPTSHSRTETSTTTTPSAAAMVGKTHREIQSSLYSKPTGKRHVVRAKKDFINKHGGAQWEALDKIESAIKRGFKGKRMRRKQDEEMDETTQAKQSFVEAEVRRKQDEEMDETTQAKQSFVEAEDQKRLAMMQDYFAQKTEEYKEKMEESLAGYRDKRQRVQSGEASRQEKASGQSVFQNTQNFYKQMQHDGTLWFHKLYQRLKQSKTKEKAMLNYDHILMSEAFTMDRFIQEDIDKEQYAVAQLCCKPYQCWMNLWGIDEITAKEFVEMNLIILQRTNHTARTDRPLPKWLVDLRGWEHSIAQEYLSNPVHRIEVVEHIKNGNYWARYHRFLREENDEVYLAKWANGTDYFPIKTTGPGSDVYWYSGVKPADSHFMTLEEYNKWFEDEKNKKKKKKKEKKGTKKNINDTGAVEVEQLDKKKKRSKTRDNVMEEDEQEMENIEHMEQSHRFGGNTLGLDGLEWLDLITVTDSEPEEEYSSSATDDSIPVNKYIYRCPLPIQDVTKEAKDEEEAPAAAGEESSISKKEDVDWDDFAGWTAYQRSFARFIQRDLLCIDECEREIARSPSEDHWRRRHLHLGNAFDLPVCQYRLIAKKLHLEHEVRENLRMIAILKKKGISASAPLTQGKYMPEWVKFRAQAHFNRLYKQIRKQQQEYTPQKKHLLDCLKSEIATREAFNREMRTNIGAKKDKLQDNLSKLKMLHDRQVSLLDYIVTAKHRVANAKLKVAYAREQVEILENDVKDLREMTPREEKFAERNKHYYEAVSTNKLCKQYHSLKRNNYDANQLYLSQYREKVKRLLKSVALYSLWYNSLHERYKTHKKVEVIETAYDMIDPARGWDLDHISLAELLKHTGDSLASYDPHKMRKEHFILYLQQHKQTIQPLPDDEPLDRKEDHKEDTAYIPCAPELERDRIEFEKVFYRKLQETAKYAALNMVPIGEQQKTFADNKAKVMRVLEKLQGVGGGADSMINLPDKKASRGSVLQSGRSRRVSEVDIADDLPAWFGDKSGLRNDGADDNKVEPKDALDRELAGGKRVDDDEFEEDDDDDDDEEEEFYDDDDPAFEARTTRSDTMGT